MHIPFSPPDISENEIQGVIEVLKSGWITTGPKTKLFEKKIAAYCNVNRAVCLNSATACMESILRLLGINKKDEIITSAYTYTASASPVCHVGAKLVLVDVKRNSYEMDYEALEHAITASTKVIIPIDLGGVMCDYERIFEIVERKKNIFQAENKIQEAIGRIVVVADSAHSFGASRNGRKCGSVADFTSFSFHAVKNLTTAEGGAITWNSMHGIKDEWVYEQFMLQSLHGQSKDALAKTKLGAWEYDILSPAYKCNMTDIMAAMGIAQLERYAKLLEKRKTIIQKYNQALRRIGVSTLEHYTDKSESSGHLYLMRVPEINAHERNKFITELAESGISTNVHYKPLPMFTAYQKLGFTIEDFPNALKQYENEITLPLHTCLTEENVEYIIKKTIECLNRRGLYEHIERVG